MRIQGIGKALQRGATQSTMPAIMPGDYSRYLSDKGRRRIHRRNYPDLCIGLNVSFAGPLPALVEVCCGSIKQFAKPGNG